MAGRRIFFARVRSVDELKSAVEFAESEKIPVFVFGGGSNIFFADAGFRGLILKNEIGGIEFTANSARVGAGEPLANFVGAAAQKNLAGVENFAGIPGSVGGAVVGNSNGLGEKISRATIFVPASAGMTAAEKILDKNSLEFKYRDSNLRGKILVAVEFELEKSSENLSAKIQKIIAEKIQKQPVENTAGSWFKNPPGESAWFADRKIRRARLPGRRRENFRAAREFFRKCGRGDRRGFSRIGKNRSRKS